jgi:hypothetical protein
MYAWLLNKLSIPSRTSCLLTDQDFKSDLPEQGNSTGRRCISNFNKYTIPGQADFKNICQPHKG